MFKGKLQLEPEKVHRDRKVGWTRIYVEQVTELAKTFKILKEGLNSHLHWNMG